MEHPIVFQSYEEVEEAIKVKAIRPSNGINTFSRYKDGEYAFPVLVWVGGWGLTHQTNQDEAWNEEEYLIELQQSKLWKNIREEFISTPIQMTIEELENVLGHKIEIIKETK